MPFFQPQGGTPYKPTLFQQLQQLGVPRTVMQVLQLSEGIKQQRSNQILQYARLIQDSVKELADPEQRKAVVAGISGVLKDQLGLDDKQIEQVVSAAGLKTEYDELRLRGARAEVKTKEAQAKVAEGTVEDQIARTKAEVEGLEINNDIKRWTLQNLDEDFQLKKNLTEAQIRHFRMLTDTGYFKTALEAMLPLLQAQQGGANPADIIEARRKVLDLMSEIDQDLKKAFDSAAIPGVQVERLFNALKRNDTQVLNSELEKLRNQIDPEKYQLLTTYLATYTQRRNYAVSLLSSADPLAPQFFGDVGIAFDPATGQFQTVQIQQQAGAPFQAIQPGGALQPDRTSAMLPPVAAGATTGQAAQQKQGGPPSQSSLFVPGAGPEQRGPAPPSPVAQQQSAQAGGPPTSPVVGQAQPLGAIETPAGPITYDLPANFSSAFGLDKVIVPQPDGSAVIPDIEALKQAAPGTLVTQTGTIAFVTVPTNQGNARFVAVPQPDGSYKVYRGVVSVTPL